MRHIRSSSLNHTKSLCIDRGTKTIPKQDKKLQPYFNYQRSYTDVDKVNDTHSRAEVLKVCIFCMFLSRFILIYHILNVNYFLIN